MAPPKMAKGPLDLTSQIFKMTSTNYSNPEPVDAVFVCIDCEAFEFAQNKVSTDKAVYLMGFSDPLDQVTELGVAVLDTKEIAGMDPGLHGEQWVEKISYAHFRPVEYANVVNRRFVKGAESLFAFGNT